jgi:hypothetical protein
VNSITNYYDVGNGEGGVFFDQKRETVSVGQYVICSIVKLSMHTKYDNIEELNVKSWFIRYTGEIA